MSEEERLRGLSLDALLAECKAAFAERHAATAAQVPAARLRLPAEVLLAADNALEQWTAHGVSLINAFLVGSWQPTAADEPTTCRTAEGKLRLTLLFAMARVLAGKHLSNG
jgi:hypothetical protein